MPPTITLRDLLRFVIFAVQERGAELYRTRLVKILYLVEVEYFRAMERRLTDARWFRYYFGPFAYEIGEAARSLGFDLETESVDFERRTGIRYVLHEDRALYDSLPQHVRGIAERVVSRWADEDLEALLDYVYVETEPMEGAGFMDRLDFSTIDPRRRRTMDLELDLPKEDLAHLKERLAEEGRISREPTGRQIDRAHAAALSSVEEAPDLSDVEGSVRCSDAADLSSIKGGE